MTKFIKYAIALAMCAFIWSPSSIAAQEQDVVRLNIAKLTVFPPSGQFFSIPRIPEWVIPLDVFEEVLAADAGLTRRVCAPKEPKPICINISVEPSILKVFDAARKNVSQACARFGGGSCMTTIFFIMDESDIEITEFTADATGPGIVIGGSIRCEIDISI